MNVYIQWFEIYCVYFSQKKFYRRLLCMWRNDCQTITDSLKVLQILFICMKADEKTNLIFFTNTRIDKSGFCSRILSFYLLLQYLSLLHYLLYHCHTLSQQLTMQKAVDWDFFIFNIIVNVFPNSLNICIGLQVHTS